MAQTELFNAKNHKYWLFLLATGSCFHRVPLDMVGNVYHIVVGYNLIEKL